MLYETVLLAQREIRRNVLRSFLTILGIVIGVASVITLVTLGSGATKQVAEQIGSLGSNMLFVRVGQGFHGPGGASSDAPPFTAEDAEAIARDISDLAGVAPMCNAESQAIYGNENWSTSVTGSNNDYLKTRNWNIAAGREFTEGEIKSGRAACILGATVQKQLFGGLDPVGQSIRLRKITFQVVGVAESKGQASFGNDQDDFVLIPIRTLQRRMAGNTHVGSILISVRDASGIDKAKHDIELLLRQRRRIAEGGTDNFNVGDMREIMTTVTGSTKILTALLGAVAAVSLVVGGIGIMNIMLVSVTERTREIGIRLAIGALGRDVMLQFLVEAVVLSCFGGLTGIVLGLATAGAGSMALHVPFVLQPGIVFLSFGVSSAVGIVFGYFPARKAAQLDPIEALRHE